jgi:DNA-binding transcriptional regulator YdaS (Cro superfamily)
MGSYNRSVVTALIAARLLEHGAQTRLAKACGVTPQTVNKWKLGQTIPAPEKWPAIERALGLEDGTIAREAGYTGPTVDEVHARLAALEDQVAELIRIVRHQNGNPAER